MAIAQIPKLADAAPCAVGLDHVALTYVGALSNRCARLADRR